jgi:esterase/lipase superfamily enzyme
LEKEPSSGSIDFATMVRACDEAVFQAHLIATCFKRSLDLLPLEKPILNDIRRATSETLHTLARWLMHTTGHPDEPLVHSVVEHYAVPLTQTCDIFDRAAKLLSRGASPETDPAYGVGRFAGISREVRGFADEVPPKNSVRWYRRPLLPLYTLLRFPRRRTLEAWRALQRDEAFFVGELFGTVWNLREEYEARKITDLPNRTGFLDRGESRALAHRRESRGMHFGVAPQKQRVFFATNRSVISDRHIREVSFCNGRGLGDLKCGVASVSIPAIHNIGQVERPPQFLTLSFSELADKHILVSSRLLLAPDDWIDSARRALSSETGSSALVFIHGYSVTFDEALRRTAALGADLRFADLLACFSWSSEGSVSGYVADLDNADLAAPQLTEFLQMMRDEVGADNVHIIAHSMGNRVLVKALRGLSVSSAGHLGEVVMAAPDVDCDVFKASVAGFLGKARRYTLYGSKHDIALAVSRYIRRKYPRIGDGGKRVFVIEGVDTIDASAVTGDILGLNHSYALVKRPVVSDLHYVIRTSTPANDRAGLAPKVKNGLPYWLLRA